VRDITSRKRLEREILEISGESSGESARTARQPVPAPGRIGFLRQALEKNRISLGVDSTAQRNRRSHDQAITLTPVRTGPQSFRLDAGGLTHASGTGCKQREAFGITCGFEFDRPIAWTMMYGCPSYDRQEALNNAIKHGRADTVVITLRTDGNPRSSLLKTMDGVSPGQAAQGKAWD